ncbi:MAG: zinc ABC transporter substrate-binding protein [Porticoccaceae bacterium]|nr:zinc ABC transporter substrate-binding protein [Porticoccaceae bacterium]MDG1306631.1 zinc ABC transporter substrate-binding protein [Porticoccaceae bacterium]
MSIKKIQYNIIAWMLVLAGNALVTQVQAETKPLIVTSIKPLAIIAASAVGDAARVQYLVPDNQSPHDFSLPMSALKKIIQADLVIWVGPDFETGSAKAMGKLPTEKLLTILHLPHTQPNRVYRNQRDEHSMEADPHLWLNPENGNHIAAEIQARLGIPIKDIISRQQISRLKAQLVSIKDKTYLTHHEAYGHFAIAFDLKPGLSIRNSSGGVQGIKTQYKLRKAIGKTDIGCIFVEPQYGNKDAAIIAAEYKLPLVELDPQGLSQDLNARAYSEFIGTLVRQFKTCHQ